MSANEDSVVLPAVLSSCERHTPGRTSLSPNQISASLLSLSLIAAHQVSGLHGTDVGHPGQAHCSGSHSPHLGTDPLTRARGTHGDVG